MGLFYMKHPKALWKVKLVHEKADVGHDLNTFDIQVYYYVDIC